MKKIESWIAPNENNLPDFIIGGAMKSGTSTLHQILNAHPAVFIPESEIHFFDIDNILQHSDFNFYNKERKYWATQSMEENPDKLWNWYFDKFHGKENFVKGEDSTTYLASKVAARRISAQRKPIKLIFTLRQPTLRAYSNYWHLLRSGRATYTFEDTIRFNPYSVLNRSLYKEQLEYYYSVLPKERIKIVLFENLIDNPKNVVAEISEFLGLDFEDFPDAAFNLHSNKGTIPIYTNLQIKKNKMMRNFGNTRYIRHLPVTPDLPASSPSLFFNIIDRVHTKINPSKKTEIPKINPETKQFLDHYFIRELNGLNELVGEDVLSKWFDMEEDTCSVD